MAIYLGRWGQTGRANSLIRAKRSLERSKVLAALGGSYKSQSGFVTKNSQLNFNKYDLIFSWSLRFRAST